MTTARVRAWVTAVRCGVQVESRRGLFSGPGVQSASKFSRVKCFVFQQTWLTPHLPLTLPSCLPRFLVDKNSILAYIKIIRYCVQRAVIPFGRSVLCTGKPVELLSFEHSFASECFSSLPAAAWPGDKLPHRSAELSLTQAAPPCRKRWLY
jgi:hypothetical protein